MTLSPPRWARWTAVLRPKWLAWHAFAVGAAAGMLWLGDWQLNRAEAGNELSWAYTFEWPLFAVLGAVFWVKTIREELGTPPSPGADDGENGADGAAGGGENGAADARRRGAAGSTIGPGTAGPEYAARLRAEVRQHGRWHGLR